MPAKRFFIAYMPVEHINGKMAPVAYKVSNVPEGMQPDANSYWFGYRHKASPNVSRYGIRTKHRLLEEKPYTIAEDENRTLFTMALQAVNEHREVAADWSLCLQAFENQKQYATLNGFAVATCRHNQGQWPQEWTAQNS